MPNIAGLLGWGKSAIGKGVGWYGGLGPIARYGLTGAATGAMTGAFGLNPLNTIPFFGDIDAGGALGGAAAGGIAGMAFGRFGYRRGAGNFLNRGRGALMRRMNAGALARGEGSLVGRGLMRGNNLLAREGLGKFTNRWGNQILASMAAGTAGLIGGSVLSTNSPY